MKASKVKVSRSVPQYRFGADFTERQRRDEKDVTWLDSVPATLRSWIDLRLCCPFPAGKKRKQKQTSEIYSEQNKKGATVAEELGICTNPQRQSERGGERDSCRILTQNMLVCPQKVHPNTITTPTTWIAAALYSTIFCHMYLVRLSTRGRSWWRHLFQVRYVMGISKS